MANQPGASLVVREWDSGHGPTNRAGRRAADLVGAPVSGATAAVSQQDRLSINWINSVGAALGAVSAAVMLSTLGVAGTLLGAALSSLCITVGGAVYARSLQVTKERLAKAQRLAASGVTRAQERTSVRTATRLAPSAEPTPDGGEPPPRQSWTQTVQTLPWKRIAAGTVGLFILAMAIIVAFELTTGRPVSSYTGGSSDTRTGTSVPGLGDRRPDTGTPGTDEQQPASPDEPQQDRPASQDPTPPAEQVTPAPPAQQLSPAPDENGVPLPQVPGQSGPTQEPAQPQVSAPPAAPQQQQGAAP